MENKISLLLLLVLSAFFSKAQQEDAQLCLNQVGFYTNGPKLAVIMNSREGSKFFIIADGKKDTVFKGLLGAERHSAYSSTITRTADFTSVRKPGKYFLVIENGTKSYPFRIANSVHHDAAVASLKGFYFMRSNQALDKKFAGKWARPAGHPDTVVFIHPSAATFKRPAGSVISSPGGWYDAGDYNKYVVNAGITTGTLLSAYEDFPAYFKSLNINIPESKDAIPDLLNEVLYNLRWMMTMQDPFDGGVYHKCTNAAFDGMVMPGVTKAARYVVQKSTAAALDLAAVCAQASRIFVQFKKQLPGLSDSCLRIAGKAWNWAIQYPDSLYNQREINRKTDRDITTGEYGDGSVKDEWLWAAAELFVTTRKQEYYRELADRMSEPARLPSWGNVAMLGYYSVLRMRRKSPAVAEDIAHAMKDTILRIAEAYISRSKDNAFGTVMGQSKSDFVWDSNAVAANQGILLLNAYFLHKEKRFLEGAISNLDYILGRNATGYCFVTGTGSKSPMHPHHRPSVADGITEPVPGLLAGGPNPGRQDGCAYPFTETETAYVDSDCAYAANEIAINWNAPLVYLANVIEALMKE